jgi:hypothetical protein
MQSQDAFLQVRVPPQVVVYVLVVILVLIGVVP